MKSSDDKQANESARVTRGADGIYRWTYEIGSKNKSLLKTYLLIFALIILIPGLILMFMISGSQRYWDGIGTYLLIWMAILAGVEILTVLIYKAAEKTRKGSLSMPFSMNDTMIMVHTDISNIQKMHYTSVPYVQTCFVNVIDITLKPESDLILLHEPLRVTHVYVPQEGLAFVLTYLFDHLPRTPKIDQKRQAYKDYV